MFALLFLVLCQKRCESIHGSFGNNVLVFDDFVKGQGTPLFVAFIVSKVL